MTTTYRTIVLHVTGSPLGLSPERFVIDHWCNDCGQKIHHDALVAHARSHGPRPASRQEGGAVE